MIAYESMGLGYFTGIFPNTAAINSTSPNVANGTPLVASILNDEWGVWQQILAMAQMTPSGVGETAAASANTALGAGQQKVGALQMAILPPGMIVLDFIVPGSGTYFSQAMAWGAASGGPPSRYQYRRVIPAIGQVVTISSYPDMCQALYCGDGNNATAVYCYKATSSVSPNSNRSTAGTFMVIPDCRGLTLRGYDIGAIHDPQGASRMLASLQQDAFQGHYHGPFVGGETFLMVYGGSSTLTFVGGGSNFPTASTTGSPVTDGANGTPRTSTETRMYNVSVNIGIAY